VSPARGLSIDAPRLALAHRPTPLEPLDPALLGLDGAALPRLWVKRDDCTGLAGGGNKTRKLEFLLGAARAAGAGSVLTFGALQSNHARQTAAACACAGLRCHLVLSDKVPGREAGYGATGNVFLDELLGATVHRLGPDDDVAAAADALEARLRADGETCARVPVGGSDATGALGYADAAAELAAQCADRGFEPAWVVAATSSGGTQAGLLAGFRALGLRTAVLGVNVSEAPGRAAEAFAAHVLELARATESRLGQAPTLAAEDVHLWHGALGPGYGVPDAATLGTVRRLARRGGLLTDPVYSGKGATGLSQWLAAPEATPAAPGADAHVVFVHTGGWPALFAYRDAFRER
jgi:L-cysteate sulfo-lyase